jgi:hypothetical protein
MYTVLMIDRLPANAETPATTGVYSLPLEVVIVSD